MTEAMKNPADIEELCALIVNHIGLGLTVYDAIELSSYEPYELIFELALEKVKAKAALATFQPDGERREAIARILADPKHQERARYVQGFLYGDDHVIRDVARHEKQELFRTKDEAAYEQRLEIERAKVTADALLASGLVQDEAGIRAELNRDGGAES